MPGPVIHLGKLTRREFRQRMSSGELRCCIIPVAAIEQHLEHMAMEHDWRSVNEIADRVATRLAPHVIIAQGLMAGISEHHMKHPGTLSLRPGSFLAVLGDMIDSMARAGFTNILVLNGHGGNIDPVRGVWPQLQRLSPVNLQWLSYWDTLTRDDARELLRSGDRLPEDLPGHAQEFETAIGLAAFAQNVRADAVKDQADDKPGLATAGAGRAIIERVVERVTAFVQEMTDGTRVAPTPGYHP